MKNILIKIYKLFGIDTSNWNILQLLFGENYIGAAFAIVLAFVSLLLYSVK